MCKGETECVFRGGPGVAASRGFSVFGFQYKGIEQSVFSASHKNRDRRVVS